MLGVLRNGRITAQSGDNKIANAGKLQIISTISYLAGFLDSKGLLEATQVNAGFISLSQAQPSQSLSDIAGGIEEFLVRLLSQQDTRGPLGIAIVGGYGAYLIKSGFDEIFKQ